MLAIVKPERKDYFASYQEIQDGPVRVWIVEFDGPKNQIGTEQEKNYTYYLVGIESYDLRSEDYLQHEGNRIIRSFVDPEMPPPDNQNPDVDSDVMGWTKGYLWVEAKSFDVFTPVTNEDSLAVLRKW